MPTFSGGFRPASAEEVADFERRAGVNLPGDYRHFLLTINGGSPVPFRVVVPGRGVARADWLYGIRDERRAGDLEYEQGEAQLWDPLPPGWLAIGHDPGGNTWLLATRGEDAGTVYFWDRVGFWVTRDGHNTFPVAASFTEFLQGLSDRPTGGEQTSADGT
jgi:hypothetical protein